MKKILKTLVVSLAMVLTMTVSVFANPANDLKNELLSLGIPSSYVGNIIEYLQKTTISEADYNKAMGYVNEAKAIIGNTKDLGKLSQKDKNTLQSLASKAGNALGLKVNFGKNAQGQTTVVVTDINGATILKMSTADVLELVTNFDISVVVEILESVVEFSNNPDKGEFTPVGGELTGTATTYPALMLLGALMVVGAGFVALKAKKQFA